ncbi:DUF1844 domain-containing protein [Egicoccus halophilus]|uniref:Uncharacterized protein n=1 Tax=Egicoccus halophilus TaxID=1670830 RepID=A0A8J3AEZ2_9ACTN|nr:DUF1844 domain-containing protein [Egicoccus halophilus]GGI07474.1 hypothetical protein GCM10011354_24280 [Egicoccus halophilus]
MSDVPFDPSQAAGQQPSEEEVRAYLGQLRVAPVEQVVAEVASALLNAAQVKLGRQDGRLLIDLVGGLTEQVRGRLPEDLTSQLDQALEQLRLAQVEAEREVTQAGAQGHVEEGDLAAPQDGDATDTGGASGGQQTPPSGGASTPPTGGPGSAASRLWVPGR